MFTDCVELTLIAGRGGNGIVAWTRAKFIPKGGPCGGNGGKGGSIYLKTSNNLFSLDAYRNTVQVKADHGADGGTNNREGKQGKDQTLLLPVGTLVKNLDTGEVLYDLTEPNLLIEICRGGRGGLGNNHFKSPTNRTPRECTPGREGETLRIELELKLIADVGFVGLPNAGKSTLLSTLTPNKVKIGAYPFTTLKPNLSYIEFDDYTRLFLADIPGIIKDAHLGRGLGLAFLRHIERCKALVFVIDIGSDDKEKGVSDFALLREELRAHSERLLDKPILIALNKADLPEAKANAEYFLEELPQYASSTFLISAKEQIDLLPLVKAMRETVKKETLLHS